MALGLVMEAILRLEYKVDALMRWTGCPMPPPMHFTAGQLCPGCGAQIDYLIDITHNVAVRRCNCKTGKVPSAFPLVPAPGAQNASADPARVPEGAGLPVEDSPERRRRGPGHG